MLAGIALVSAMGAAAAVIGSMLYYWRRPMAYAGRAEPSIGVALGLTVGLIIFGVLAG